MFAKTTQICLYREANQRRLIFMTDANRKLSRRSRKSLRVSINVRSSLIGQHANQHDFLYNFSFDFSELSIQLLDEAMSVCFI